MIPTEHLRKCSVRNKLTWQLILKQLVQLGLKLQPESQAFLLNPKTPHLPLYYNCFLYQILL